MSDTLSLFATTAPANLPQRPSQVAWRALRLARPTLDDAGRARGAVIVQPYFDHGTRQRWRSLDQPLGLATLCPARRQPRGFSPGWMRVDALQHAGLQALDAFPYLGPGAEVDARILGVRVTADRLQAELLLDVGGHRLTVFDAGFTQARAVYRPEQRYRFALTALALTLGPQPADDPMRLRPARRASTHGSGELRRVQADAAVIHGQPLWRLTLRSWIGPQALLLPVLAHAQGLAPDWEPTTGEAAGGRLWLQAELVGPA